MVGPVAQRRAHGHHQDPRQDAMLIISSSPYVHANRILWKKTLKPDKSLQPFPVPIYHALSPLRQPRTRYL